MSAIKNIVIRGARVNNLKNVSIQIPRNSMTVVTGLSGSGKSSLAFDTIFAEGQRRYIESLSNYAKHFFDNQEKPQVDSIEGLSPTISIDQKSSIRSPRSTVATMSDIYDYLRLLYSHIGTIYCPTCNLKLSKVKQSKSETKASGNNHPNYKCTSCDYQILKPNISFFSFNSPEGACLDCKGLGKKLVIDSNLIMPNINLTILEGAIRPWSRSTSQSKVYSEIYSNLGKYHKINLNIPIKKMSKANKELILFGTPEIDKNSHQYFAGVVSLLDEKYKSTSSEYIKKEIKKYMVEKTCFTCKGARLRKESLSIKVNGLNIYQLTNMTVVDIEKFFKNHKYDSFIKPVVDQIILRLGFLKQVGLDYLTLSRPSTTISGGEAQRIRLSTQLGSYLTGVIYILDEPSIGLHSRDQYKLIQVLKKLRDLQNTVIVVEHDKSTMQSADYIVDLGPGAGEFGGKIVEKGSYGQLINSKRSLTAKYLRGEKKSYIPTKRRLSNKYLIIRGARENNLKNINVRIPLNTLTCVTGVSGSGKSSLVNDILASYLKVKFHNAKKNIGKHKQIVGCSYLDKAIVVDQLPIGKTPRSNPATYTGIFNLVRDLYANIELSKKRGYGSGHFSFNVIGGRCENCKGDGMLKFEMHFLPDSYVVCPLCKGSRYNKKILEVQYRPDGQNISKNIAQVLEMTVSQAMIFFRSHKLIYHKLKILDSVGLGYLRLGQSATTLSGGEAQRIKLATELARKDTAKTLYILDEPTTGLHFEDVNKLLKLIHALIDKGNSVIVIEHNMDVIKSADYIIDLGPEGGNRGGQIVAQGTPEEIMKNPLSITGQYLKI
jgi:excinuclease ABC subunit A